jgi:hypothetical protein
MIVVTFAFSILSFVSPNEIRVQSHLILVPRAYGGRKRRALMVPKLRQSKERVSRSRKKQKKIEVPLGNQRVLRRVSNPGCQNQNIFE